MGFQKSTLMKRPLSCRVYDLVELPRASAGRPQCLQYAVSSFNLVGLWSLLILEYLTFAALLAQPTAMLLSGIFE